MKRATIVLGTTAAGLAALLTFRTPPAVLATRIPGASLLPSPKAPVAAGPPSGSSGSTPGSSGSNGSSGSSGSSGSTSTPTASQSHARTAIGAPADYSYGVLSVSVTATGHKITDVQIASLDDGGDFRSQSIDQQALPVLEQEALQAQGAGIQGVSGATYTTQGFVQSLQSALSKLGI